MTDWILPKEFLMVLVTASSGTAAGQSRSATRYTALSFSHSIHRSA